MGIMPGKQTKQLASLNSLNFFGPLNSFGIFQRFSPSLSRSDLGTSRIWHQRVHLCEPLPSDCTACHSYRQTAPGGCSGSLEVGKYGRLGCRRR